MQLYFEKSQRFSDATSVIATLYYIYLHGQNTNVPPDSINMRIGWILFIEAVR